MRKENQFYKMILLKLFPDFFLSSDEFKNYFTSTIALNAKYNVTKEILTILPSRVISTPGRVASCETGR